MEVTGLGTRDGGDVDQGLEVGPVYGPGDNNGCHDDNHLPFIIFQCLDPKLPLYYTIYRGRLNMHSAYV